MPKRTEELDIIAQLATTSLSNTEAQKPQGIQKNEPRAYNFVSSTAPTVPQHATAPPTPNQEQEPIEEDEDEDETVQMSGSSTGRKVNYACTECRKAHKACSGGRPCERCAKLGLESKCRSSTRKKRLITKKYWFDFLQQQQQQQNNNPNGPKQSIFVDHFEVENMKKQLETKVMQRQKQQFRTNETFHFQTYVPPVNMQQQYPQESNVLSPRADLYSSPRGSLDQQSPRVLSPRQELYSPRVSALEQQMARGLSLDSPRMQQQFQQQQQPVYDSPRQLQSPRMHPYQQQTQSPRIQQQQYQQQQFQMQQQQQQSPRFNALPNNFEGGNFAPQGFDNVHANLYQSPRLGTGISPRVSETNQPLQSPRMGIMSPRVVDSNAGSPRLSQQVYSPRPVEHVSNVNSPRAPFSPRTSFSPPSASLESYSLNKNKPMMQDSLPSIPQLESLTELTKGMPTSGSPRFQQQQQPQYSEQYIVDRQLQQQYQNQQQQQQFQNFNQQWR